MLEKFKKNFDKLYKLDGLRVENGIKILHISDTPDSIYPFIFSVIDRLKPDYIIHTGDLVDNIKLGCGAPLKLYQKSLKNLVNEFNKRTWADKVYFVPGNHDDLKTVKDLSPGIDVFDEGSIINIKGLNFGLAHYKENLPDEADINLYGHDKTLIDNSSTLYLNGLLAVNIILLPDKKIENLSYPLKTDSGRQYKRLKLP